MFSGNGRASNRLVVGRGTDAGNGGSMQHSHFWRGVSRRVQLFAGLGLAVALLATLVTLQALPLQAQSTTPVTLISSDPSGDVFGFAGAVAYGVKLQTGPDAGDYTISAILLPLAADSGVNSDATVRIREDSGGQPGDLVGAPFDPPSTLTTTGLNAFTAPAGTVLASDTTYWLTINEEISSGGLAPKGQVAKNVNTGYGWNVHGGHSTRSFNQPAVLWDPHMASLLFEIRGIGIPASTDATLSDLVLRDASSGDAITLNPGFAPGHFDYSASVGSPVSQVTVRPTKNDAEASIRYLDELNEPLGDADTSRSGFQVGLAEGAPKVIKVEVTAEDGTPQTYTLTVTRTARLGEVLLSERVLSVTEGSTGYYSVVLSRRPAANVRVTVREHGGNVLDNLDFTPTDWHRVQWMGVSTVSDADRTNESVRLTHTVTSPDSLFDGITVPSVVVNVDDQDAPDYHIHTIRVPRGSHELPYGEKPLPEEEFEVDTGVFFGSIEGVAEGHIWRPSGLWGDPGTGIVWVVDPSHFGIHALELSVLREGRIERRVAADTSEFDQRLNYRCHFGHLRASGRGNPSLTVMWGTGSQLWVANENSGTIDSYSRDNDVTSGCYTRHVTSWATDLQSYTAVAEDFKSPFEFDEGIDVSRGPRTIRGIWASTGRVWVSGPSSGLSAGGVYAFNLSPNYFVAEVPGYDGHVGDSYGLWSDGTTMWVATDSGWLRAYDLDTGDRSAEFDIRIQTYGMPPGDIWSDGETIWVTNRGGKIDAYLLPVASGGSSTLRATEAEPLTASFTLAPEAHDGENGFKLRIAFSDAVEITPEDMRDHALLVSGGTVTGAAGVKGRSDLWELTVEPAGTGPVSILAPLDRPCTDPGALCTADGRSLTAGPALVVPGPTADNPPGVPDQLAGTAVFIGGVDLEWNDVPGADSYDVQLGRGGQWIDLPADGVEVAFYGAGAIISGLDPEATLWFQVRAANGHGVSDWSATLALSSTSQFKKGRKAMPNNKPASGAPVVHGTAQAGESLWADASGIEDRNGLNRVQFRYQWTSNDGTTDTDIAGATDSGYTLLADDVGKTIKVEVAFTDRRGYSETRTSVATGAVAAAPNNPATGAPAIIGTAQVGETLTADIKGIADDDGLTNATYSYQWMAGWTDIPGATGSSYTLTADDEGLTIQVWVGFIDDSGTQEALTSAATGTVSPAAQQQAANSPATGQPTITGTAQVGETLTANTSGIADDDGLTTSTFSYQWVANDGTADTDIAGATSSTYTLVAADEGRTIKVRVTFTDDAGNETTLTSTATDAVGFAVQQQAANTPATGEPTISGTAQVGETLTANTSGIADDDGLTNSTFSYQWVANDGTTDTDISGATDATYTLVAGDEGRTIKVRVIVTDDLGNETTLTSAATEAVAAAPQPDSPATGLPTISGTAQVGETLTANTSGIADSDGLTTSTSTYSYQWLADDAEIGGATDSTYTLVAADEGRTIKVRVTVTDDLGNETTLTSAATEVVATAPQPDSPATGEPTISGTVRVGETLTAETSGIADADGLTTSTYSYQWLSDDAEIGGATGSTYTLVAADEGRTIKVRVIVTDDLGNETTLTSAATEAVAAAPQPDSPATGLPTIIGTAQVGETLTANTSGIADDDGLTTSTFSYQWVANDGTTDTDISGATDATYTLVAADEGRTIKVRVIVTDDLGNETTLTSAATEAVAAAPQPDSPATGEPTISGTPQVGQTLIVNITGIADSDGLDSAVFAYQWLSDDAEIGGATGSNYTLVDDDEGRTIKVRVTVTDDLGNETTLTSAATEAVAAAPQPDSPATGEPTISGTPQVGQTLIVNITGIADSDGLDSAVFAYQWLADDAEIVGATGSNYTLVDDDEGRTIKVRVTVTDDLGNETTLTSGATGEVASGGPTEPPGRPLKLKGAANADGTVTLRWEAPDDDTVTGYQILRKRSSRGEQTLLVHVNDTGSTATEYTDSDVTPDVLHAYRVKAINAAGLSKRSNVVKVTPVEPEQPSGNSAATGGPSIGGTPQVGEVLTADTTGIGDDDGLDNVSYSYQWVVTDGGAYIDISGETGATYTLVAADRGLRILVRVSFTDDAGNRETLTSAATEVVAAAP